MAGESRGNHFVNDGSFMEMFRRLQEQQNQSSNQPVDENAQMEGSRSKLPCNTSGGASMVTRDTARESKGTIPRTTQLVETRNDKKKVEDDEKTGIADLPPLAKASQGVMLGKRKALMKTIELREKRKRRREEIEEKQQLAEQEEDKKSSAWKAYMAQVKAYEARSCSDEDGHRRPLVK